jgi:hypothetical protein
MFNCFLPGDLVNTLVSVRGETGEPERGELDYLTDFGLFDDMLEEFL